MEEVQSTRTLTLKQKVKIARERLEYKKAREYETFGT